MKRKLMCFVCAMLCILTLAQPALAATNGVEVEIPVKVFLKEDVPHKAETFNIILKRNDDANPMPGDSEGGRCVLPVKVPIKSHGEEKFEIPFDRVGIYEYTVYQEKGTDDDCVYDRSVFHVVVTITNKKGGGLESTVAIREDDEEKKTDIEFVNVYPYEPYDNPKTDDESNFPLYATLAAGSVLVLAALFLTRKREEESF